jgi:hypothetical protein
VDVPLQTLQSLLKILYQVRNELHLTHTDLDPCSLSDKRVP